VSPDGKSVRGDRFPVADAFEERVAGDDVFVFTCSVVILVLLFDLKKKNRKEVSALILVIIREKRDYREHEREIESKNERTSIDNEHVPVMVTVLVLLCFEENVACGTTLSPEPTKFVARCWCRAWCCSLPPPVPPPEVLFIVVLLFSFSCNYELCDGETTKKQRHTKKEV
jgi:hypothetical protein